MEKKSLCSRICLIMIICSIIVSCLCLSGGVASAAEKVNNKNMQVCGLFVNLSISISGENGKISAVVHNDFELFSSVVQVYVQLYCSVNYTTNYSDMRLVAENYTADLDKNQTIKVTATVGDSSMYWIARMYYRVDKKSWEERIVGPALYDNNGNYIG